MYQLSWWPITGWCARVCFPVRVENKLCRGGCVLASYQVSSNSIQRSRRKSLKCLSQSKAVTAILFSYQPPKHKLGRGTCVHTSCKLLSKPYQWLGRRQTSETLTTAREGQVVSIVHWYDISYWGVRFFGRTFKILDVPMLLWPTVDPYFFY